MKRAPRRSTVPRTRPPRSAPPRPLAPRPHIPHKRPPARAVVRIVDGQETSLIDIVDGLLNKGVVLNADLILSLADVDLVYVRLSALLSAADRIVARKR